MQPVWSCSLHMDMRREPERLKNTGLRARRKNTRTMSTIPHIQRVESRARETRDRVTERDSERPRRPVSPRVGPSGSGLRSGSAKCA